jgi:hypothetical protein
LRLGAGNAPWLLASRGPKAPLHVVPKCENRALATPQRARDSSQPFYVVSGELTERAAAQEAGTKLWHRDILSAAGSAGVVERVDEPIPQFFWAEWASIFHAV